MIGHMIGSQGHVPVSQNHVGKSSSLLFDYSLALGAGWVDLEVYRVIPSLGRVVRAKPVTLRDHKAVLQKKVQITVEELSKGLPTPFYEFVIHIHSLGFDQKPHYQYLRSVLLQCSGTKIDQPGKALLFAASPLLVWIAHPFLVTMCK